MKGTVEVYSVNGDKWDKIYEENNLVVHGGRKAIADIFSFVPAPSGLMTEDFASGAEMYAVSNFTIQSMTLGAGTNTLKYSDSRHGVTQHSNKGTQFLDVSGRTYSLLPYKENFLTDEIGAWGTKKESVTDYSVKHYVDLNLSGALTHKYGKVQITRDKRDGGSVTVKKNMGQDLVIIEIPTDLNLATDYKFNLGIEGKLPVQLEIIREDKIDRRNALTVDLREQRWDFSKSRFVFLDEQVSDDNLRKTLYASSVPKGEVTETYFSTAFDKVDQAKRVERFTYSFRLTCPKTTHFEKGSVRIYSARVEVLNNLILKNPNFTRVESFVDNTSFKDLKPYDVTLTPTANVEQLKAAGVYQIGGWEHPSPLYASAGFLDLTTSADCLYGWVAIENVDAYGTSGSPPATKDGDESNIGVAFNGRQLYWDSSSTAQLSKTFKYPGQWLSYYSQTGTRFELSSLLNDPYTTRTLVIKMDVNSVSATDSGNEQTGVGLRLKNITKGLSYNFVSGTVLDKGDWSQAGASATLAAGQAVGTNVTTQANVTMPLAFANDTFKLDIIGHAGDANEKGKLVIRNLDIGQYEGWHFHEGLNPSGAMSVSSMAGSPTSALALMAPNNTFDVDFRLVSSIGQLTYLSQTISGLDPEKAYNLIVEADKIGGTPDPKFAVALVHKGYGDPYKFDYGRYLTVGLPQNAGNVFNKYFDPTTSVSGFTMFGPNGPPTDEYRDLDFKDHQRCVKWTNIASLGTGTSSLLYKYISSGTGQEDENNYHVNLPDGNFNMSLDLRHVFDRSIRPSYGLYNPVGTRIRVDIPARPPGWGWVPDVFAYYYDFYKRKFVKVIEKGEGAINLETPRWTHTLVPGSYGPPEYATEQYTRRARSPKEIYQAAGDPKGWHHASLYFDVKSGDFASDAPRVVDTDENHVNHTIWGTRKIELIFTTIQANPPAKPDIRGATPVADPAGTVYIKNFSLRGPTPPREPANTYFVYAGAGVWNATSGINSLADFSPEMGTGPITGVRPSKMVTSGVSTWNPLQHGDENRKDFTFFQRAGESAEQMVDVIYGMSALGTSFGTSRLDSTGEDFYNNHAWSATKDSIYELMLFPLAGAGSKLQGVYLSDASLTHYNGPTLEKYAERNKITSQPDVSGLGLRHLGGWSTQFIKTRLGVGSYTTDYPRVYSFASSTPVGDESYIAITKDSNSTWQNMHTTNLCYFDTVENWGMKPGKNHAFSFDYAATGCKAQVGVFMQHENTLFWLSGISRPSYNANGKRLFPLTKWVPSDVKKGTRHSWNLGFTDSLPALNVEWKSEATSLSENFLTNEFHIPPKIPDGARIGIMIRNEPIASAFSNVYRNLRAYVCNDRLEVDVKLPEFPHEQDAQVQTSTEASSPGEYGHFQNSVEFKYAMQNSPASWGNTYNSSAVTHIPTQEKAIHRGAYLPASGLLVSAGALGYAPGAGTYGGWGPADTSSLSGTLNLYSVVTPKGHILNNFSAININDSSAGLFVSGPVPDLSADGNCIVRYALSLSSNEVHYLDFYGGGIETAGLWTIDWARSAAKRSFAGDRKPPFLVSSLGGTPYAQSIYNLNDYEEPEWSLFAKKIFMAGGLKPQATSDYLTIVWSLKF